MKNESLADIAQQLIGEGMAPDSAMRMLNPLDSASPEMIADFTARFWSERTRPTVATDLAIPDPAAEDALAETADVLEAESVGTPYAWPAPDPAEDDRLPLGDGDHVYLEELILWLGEQKWSSFCLSLAKFYRERSYLTERQTSAAISTLVKTAARKGVDPAELVATTVEALSEPVATLEVDPPKVTSKPTDPGVYVMEGELYRVKWNRAKTHLYAEHIVADNASGEVTYEYAPGVARMLDKTRRIDAVTARSFGVHYGACVFCGRRLTNGVSIEVGYGPICAVANGLPHKSATMITPEMLLADDSMVVGDDPDDGPVAPEADSGLSFWVDALPEDGKYIPLIKAVREAAGFGLKEARDLVVAGSVGPFASHAAAEAVAAKMMPHAGSLKIAQR